MIMKKNVMFVVMMVASVVTFAQRPQGDVVEMADKVAGRLKNELSLKDDQYAQVRAITEKFAESHAILRAQTGMSMATLHSTLKSLNVEQQAQMRTVLTDDQWILYTALKAKRAGDWKEHKERMSDKLSQNTY